MTMALWILLLVIVMVTSVAQTPKSNHNNKQGISAKKQSPAHKYSFVESLWHRFMDHIHHPGGTIVTENEEEENSHSGSSRSTPLYDLSLVPPQSQQQQQQSDNNNNNNNHYKTRRRALYEYALSLQYESSNDHHFSPPLSSSLSSQQKQPQPEILSMSWTDSNTGCVYYSEDESSSSYWTFQWCPRKHSLMQQHWEPRAVRTSVSKEPQIQWKLVQEHSLGKHMTNEDRRFKDELKSWMKALGGARGFLQQPRTDDDRQSSEEDAVTKDEKQKTQQQQKRPSSSISLDVYTDGALCGSKKERRRALLIRQPPLCHATSLSPPPTQPWEEWRIASVTEPEPCHYVVSVCQVDSEKREELVIDEDDDKEEENTSLNASGESSSESTESAPDVPSKQESDDSDQHVEQTPQQRILQAAYDAYMYETGVDWAEVKAADRITSLHRAMPPFPQSRQEANRELVRSMFQHAYDSYMYHAFPAAELRPLTCTPGTFDLVKLPALTLVDTIDTLLVMGNVTEFARSVERLRQLHGSMEGGLFGVAQNVSVFETNIRVLGGLLSGHQLAEAYIEADSVERSHVFDKNGHVRIGYSENDAYVELSDNECGCTDVLEEFNRMDMNEQCAYTVVNEEAKASFCDKNRVERSKACCNSTAKSSARKRKIEYWTYDGVLLRMAHDLGRRLLPAFETKTGIPYGTVNLLHGIPRGETTVASLAGGGTLTLEMELLSRLTGDESFGNAAKLASRALWMRRSPKHLLGKHINIDRGDWTETTSGIGSNSDSFYEYLIKHYILFPDDDDFWTMFVSAYNGVHNETRLGEWYPDADMNIGLQNGIGRRVLESLMAFYPGMQVLLGELAPAARTLNSFLMVRELLGFLPERFNYGNWQIDGGPSGAANYPLRPELLESCYFLHRAARGLSVGPSPLGNGTNFHSPSGWQWAADYALHALHRMTDAIGCGFASVENIGPSTTGGIPGREGHVLKHVRLANEMPSFFLSETLKYLYLAFDDTNVLHTDSERDWIFTTEAHPIHSVHLATLEPSDSALLELEEMKERLVDRLHQRLKKKHKRKENSFVSLEKASILRLEKWTPSSQFPAYLRHIRESYSDTLSRKQERALHKSQTPHEIMDFVEAFALQENDSFHDEERNLAYLSIGSHGLGDGSSLMKACPNFHSSSLDWIRALHGGILDYSDIYLSSLSNEEKSLSSAGIEALSAIEALALHGSGLYLGENYDGGHKECVLTEKNDASTLKKREKGIVPKTDDGPAEGMERYDMGEIGKFDLSIISDGAGFVVRHVGSGEVAVATIVDREDATTNANPFVMVYYEQPPVKSDSEPITEKTDMQKDKAYKGISLMSLFGHAVKDTGADESSVLSDTIRRVVVVDAENAPFRCEVQLFETSSPSDLESFSDTNDSSLDKTDETAVDTNDEDDVNSDTEKVWATFPCAPALFGPTLMSHLASTGGVLVDGIISPPDKDDEQGCRDPNELEPANPDPAPSITMVHRGNCTFESKAMNHRQRHDSEAVIVINTRSEELFLMSDGDRSEEDTCDAAEMEIPVTVMVTGQDGKDMLSMIQDHNATLGARVSLKASGGANDVDWPVVRVGHDHIQVYAQGGWGIQATVRSKANRGGKREWQIFLLKHNGLDRKESRDAAEKHGSG